MADYLFHSPRLAAHGISPWPRHGASWWEFGGLPPSLLPLAAAADAGDVAAVEEILALATGTVPAEVLNLFGDGERPVTGPDAARSIARRMDSQQLVRVSQCFGAVEDSENSDAACLEAAGALLARGETLVRPSIVEACMARGAEVAHGVEELRMFIGLADGGDGDARDAVADISVSLAAIPDVRAAARAWGAARDLGARRLDTLHAVAAMGQDLCEALHAGGGLGASAVVLTLLCARLHALTARLARAEATIREVDAAAASWVAAAAGHSWAPPRREMTAMEAVCIQARSVRFTASPATPYSNHHLGNRANVALKSASIVASHASVAQRLLMVIASNGDAEARLAASIMRSETYRFVMQMPEECPELSVSSRTQLLLCCNPAPPPGHVAYTEPLVHAIAGGDAAGLPLARLLLAAGADARRLSGLDRGGALIIALSAGCGSPAPGMIRLLVEEGGVDVNETFAGRGTALSFAALHGLPWAVEALLAVGALMEVPGQAPMHHPLVQAACSGIYCTDAMGMLIRAGADVHVGIDMPIRFAASLGHLSAARMLRSAGARLCRRAALDEQGVQYGDVFAPPADVGATDEEAPLKFIVPAAIRAGDWRVRAGLMELGRTAVAYEFEEVDTGHAPGFCSYAGVERWLAEHEIVPFR